MRTWYPAPRLKGASDGIHSEDCCFEDLKAFVEFYRIREGYVGYLETERSELEVAPVETIGLHLTRMETQDTGRHFQIGKLQK